MIANSYNKYYYWVIQREFYLPMLWYSLENLEVKQGKRLGDALNFLKTLSSLSMYIKENTPCDATQASLNKSYIPWHVTQSRAGSGRRGCGRVGVTANPLQVPVFSCE